MSYHDGCSSDSLLQGLRKCVSRVIGCHIQHSEAHFSVFIAEITARAFIIADANKRRTLSRSDIAKALSKSDQFDFLIDIVPRDDLSFPGAGMNGAGGKKVAGSSSLKGHDQVCVYHTMPVPRRR